MDILQQMDIDSKEHGVRLPSDSELMGVGELANEQLRLEGLVAEQELALKELKVQLTDVREFKLPSALEALGMSSIVLVDGAKVVVKEDVYASIAEENREPAFEWLETTGNDGIIKNEVKCPFGKGQDDQAKELVELLSQRGFSYTNARSVHPQTLKAFVRKQLEDGLPVPIDIFSIHIKKVASIELPRKRK